MLLLILGAFAVFFITYIAARLLIPVLTVIAKFFLLLGSIILIFILFSLLKHS